MPTTGDEAILVRPAGRHRDPRLGLPLRGLRQRGVPCYLMIDENKLPVYKPVCASCLAAPSWPRPATRRSGRRSGPPSLWMRPPPLDTFPSLRPVSAISPHLCPHAAGHSRTSPDRDQLSEGTLDHRQCRRRLHLRVCVIWQLQSRSRRCWGQRPWRPTPGNIAASTCRLSVSSSRTAWPRPAAPCSILQKSFAWATVRRSSLLTACGFPPGFARSGTGRNGASVATGTGGAPVARHRSSGGGHGFCRKSGHSETAADITRLTSERSLRLSVPWR